MADFKNKRLGALELYSLVISGELIRPLISDNLSAGFPSPAMDFIDNGIDLHQLVVKHPSTTYYGRVNGHSMINIGIHHGDLLVIDKSIKPKTDRIAVCYLDGEFVVKLLQFEKDYCLLVPANDKYKSIKVTSENDFIIWGIVTHVLKTFK